MKTNIAHIDLDCFFVSVERITNPSLLGKPVVVGGDAEGRGVIASASYEARKFGIHSAMSTAQALRLCPQLTVVHGHHSEYSSYSNRLYKRMLDIAPVVERASIDEMYLDFTGCESLYENDLPGYMIELHKLVYKEFNLPCTIALASNKLVAKIAVNQVKPNGVTFIPHGTEEKYLAPLPIGVIPGVGKKTEELLKRNGFQIVNDLQMANPKSLGDLLGMNGDWIYKASHGIGSSQLEVEHTAKSISKEETFSKDISDIGEMEKILHELVQGVCSSLRRKSLKSTTVTVKYRTSDFKTFSKQRKIEPTNFDPDIFDVAKSILGKLHDGKRKVRLIGVGLSDFVNENELTQDLFTNTDKQDSAMKALDSLRKKFGDDVIKIG
ncbi:MAG: DNA polymerase IV [Ignavibacteriales bacterium]|nr:DNA polymerase IV [Ignavibacteriales bacterium]